MAISAAYYQEIARKIDAFLVGKATTDIDVVAAAAGTTRLRATMRLRQHGWHVVAGRRDRGGNAIVYARPVASAD